MPLTPIYEDIYDDNDNKEEVSFVDLYITKATILLKSLFKKNLHDWTTIEAYKILCWQWSEGPGLGFRFTFLKSGFN